MELDFFWIGAGIAGGLIALGYFIGDGLKNFKNPKAGSRDYPILIKENDLHAYIGLPKEVVDKLLSKYPNAPKVKLEDTTYYPYHQFLDWLSSDDIYKD